MLIEIHMIQNHSPANLNRDDLGAPKSCLFGGVVRARISSQCLKRSIRRSADFQKAMEHDGGVRTRGLITELAREAWGREDEPIPEKLTKLVTDAFGEGGVKTTGKGEEPSNTNILMFIPKTTRAKLADAVRDAWERGAKAKELTEALAVHLGEKAAVPDIALCGRMTELDSAGVFAKIDFTVEAALSAAHAISTHEAINEVDYFTAVDDLAKGAGAGHVNEAMFASACFYKHFCIDWDQLVRNLDDNRELARLTVRQFLYGAAMSTPSGKQKSFAAFNPPDGVLVEVKTKRCIPMSYANAFADPVPPRAPRGLIGESIARLGQHVGEMTEGYGLEASRLWFSPAGRHPLLWVSGGQEMPVVAQDRCIGSLDVLVAKTMEAIQETDGSQEV